MRTLRRILSLGAVLALVAIPASLPAIAQSGTTGKVTHRQSVRTELSPTGEVGTSRVFTQLTVEGDGPVRVSLPSQSTSSLRNLDGFGGPGIEGDTVTYQLDATRDGVRRRTVADHTAPQAVSINVSYMLDGRDVEPEDIVGATGEVTVTYTVTNLTSRPQEITSFDGQGKPSTNTVDVAVPMVGTLSTTLDGRFVDIEAPGAAVAGDGRGSTVVSWSLLLFAPLGDEQQTVSYTAHVNDGLVPPATAQILPVNSRSFRSLRSTQDAYKSGVQGLKDLTNGALIVDGNVKLLGDGAAQLLDGLNQLSDGAQKLNEGLEGSAAPGAQQLSDGLGKARTGGDQLASGLGDLESGARRLADGLGSAKAGGTQLDQGLQALAAGAGQLSDGLSGSAAPGARQLADGLAGSAVAGAQQLQGGIKGLIAGVGESTHTAENKTVIGGLNSVQGGLGQVQGGLGQVSAGVGAVRVQQSNPCTLPAGIADCGIEQLTRTVGGVQVQQIDAALQSGGAPAGTFTTQLATFGSAFAGTIFAGAGFSPTDQCAQVVLGAQALQGAFGPDAQAGAAGIFMAPVDTTGLIGNVVPACLSALKAQGSSAGLGQVLGGIGQVSGGISQVSAGVTQILGGLNNPTCDRTKPTDPANPCGIKQVLELLDAGAGALIVGLGDAATGAGALADGLDGAAAGSTQLADGADRAAAGSGALVAGLTQLDDGAGQLAAGAGRAAAGSGDLADGLRQLDDGAAKLASGLGDAADGSGQLADGLVSAAEGGEKIADGTVALSERGMGAIIEGTTTAASGPSLLLEHAKAADQRGRSADALPYGTANGAEATAIYSYVIAGVGSDEGPSTPARGAATVLAFAAVGGLGFALRRQLV
jgi:putative membrane protein